MGPARFWIAFGPNNLDIISSDEPRGLGWTSCRNFLSFPQKPRSVSNHLNVANARAGDRAMPVLRFNADRAVICSIAVREDVIRVVVGYLNSLARRI